MKMEKLIVISGVVALASVMAGCSTMKKSWAATKAAYEASTEKLEGWSAEYNQAEYKRLSALPPAQMVAVSPSPDIDNLAISVAACARLSCDFFNVAQLKMKAYVAFTETSTEYIGFINDVNYCIEKENMSSQEASKKVSEAVIAADANRPDGQKIWPKILKSFEAARQLGQTSGAAQIKELRSSYLEISKSLGEVRKRLHEYQKELRKLKKNHQIDENTYVQSMSVIRTRNSECAAVQTQLSDAGGCISIIDYQYRRVKKAEAYAR